jgi:hypothetical protein
MVIRYTCPVCAYPDMTLPVEEGNLCPCCGTEFGYDDGAIGLTYEQIRDRWVADGAHWFSRVTQQPDNWDGLEQLALAGHEFEVPDEDVAYSWQPEAVYPGVAVAACLTQSAK